MRESAAKAGIPNESLLIALEPEAASLCCRHSPMTSLKGSQKFYAISAGNKVPYI
ncbi:hypothetical protein DPMN_108557 [Dreissena polymorpha]|uniref:Uncharacterized protein n=1 Tax=Dreissena polymorpha TaxID=45954 RepID=A0A9D4K936_DREPO|nr:hypothetical protein DPMN_108557 [Dreissena polymorpha]